jgi:hypothetical protein
MTLRQRGNFKVACSVLSSLTETSYCQRIPLFPLLSPFSFSLCLVFLLEIQNSVANETSKNSAREKETTIYTTSVGAVAAVFELCLEI